MTGSHSTKLNDRHDPAGSGGRRVPHLNSTVIAGFAGATSSTTPAYSSLTDIIQLPRLISLYELNRDVSLYDKSHVNAILHGE
jgi:hypothetical protein